MERADPAQVPLGLMSPNYSTGPPAGDSDQMMLCPRHIWPSVCDDRQCDMFHVCRLLMKGDCPCPDTVCPMGHLVKCERNQLALKKHDLQKPTDTEKRLRRFVGDLMGEEAVTKEEYQCRLTVCEEYVVGAYCDPRCHKIHVCPRFVQGQCGECHLSHRVKSTENLRKLYNFRCEGMTEEELVDLVWQAMDTSCPALQDQCFTRCRYPVCRMCDTGQKDCEVSNTSFKIICTFCKKLVHEGSTDRSLRKIFHDYTANLKRSDEEKQRSPIALRRLQKHVEASPHPGEDSDSLRLLFRIERS